MGGGKRKVEMKPIEEKSHRNVAFSKRWQGLFKKAAKLSTLTGAKVALLVVSPAERACTFGDQTLLRHGALVPPDDQGGPRLALEAAPKNGSTTTTMSTTTLTADNHHNVDREATPSISEMGDYNLAPLPEDWSIQEILDSVLSIQPIAQRATL